MNYEAYSNRVRTCATKWLPEVAAAIEKGHVPVLMAADIDDAEVLSVPWAEAQDCLDHIPASSVFALPPREGIGVLVVLTPSTEAMWSVWRQHGVWGIGNPIAVRYAMPVPGEAGSP